MIFKGFRFGMLLQLAVGPMCLLVFNTSATSGFFVGSLLVVAIALVDALFITLSGFGVAAIINKAKVKLVIKILGCIVLVVFGANTIAGAFDISLLPGIPLFSDVSGRSAFVQGLLLTASNPLTIIFWSGVFSTQVIENNYNRSQLFFFGLGCIISTLSALTFIALLGSIVSGFLPNLVMQILNIGVGTVLIYFGIRLLFKKEEERQST